MNTSGLGGQAANFGIGTLKRMPLKWNQHERQRRSAPSPLVGEGWGGGVVVQTG